MRSIIRQAMLVVFVLLFLGYFVFPPEENLRLGKDLRGGVSLVYSVQNRAGSQSDAKEVINRTIEVLKNRVDPNGLYEISMVAQGTDRIEVQMPLPSAEVIELKREFEKELEGLAKASLTRVRIDNAIAATTNRAASIDELAHGNANRKKLLEEAAAAFDSSKSKREAYTAEVDAAKKELLAGDVAAAEIAYDDAARKVLATALSADELRRAVMLSPRPRDFFNKDGKLLSLPSQRAEAEKRLRESNPESLAEIDAVIQKYDAYAAQRKGFDDTEELKRMLRGAGVLSFRIGVDTDKRPDEQSLRSRFRELGPRNASAEDARWFKLNRLDGWIDSKEVADAFAANPDYGAQYFAARGHIVEHRNGEFFMLLWDTPGTRLTQEDHRDNPWAIASAGSTRGETGKIEIIFAMDPVGARYLGELTSKHVGQKMAVLLDDEVYTAPNLQSAISSSGRITGSYTASEVDYIVRTLTGGSLQAALSPSPISEDTIAPQLGADNLRMGLWAGVYSAIVVAVFMIFYYFQCGFIAVLSLLVNAAIILGAMALSKAAFTLPGIAGVILTFGMAVDSNVLIYERMREEMVRGADLKSAVRIGFDKALSSIVDGNMTNLIVCFALYWFGTPEIKGFAITMGIGVLSTLFAALVVSRLLFDLGVELGWRKTSMLPMAVPGLQAALTPRIDWLKYRYVFFGISAVYVGLGLGMIFFVQGKRMLDNQFLGGTKVTLQLRTDGTTGQPLTLTRAQVDERISKVVAADTTSAVLRPLRNAEIIPLNPERDGVTSSRFDIKVGPTPADVIPDPEAIPSALKVAFEDVMDIRPELTFVGSDQINATRAPVYPIEKPQLGDNIDRPGISDQVPAFIGGAAIVLDDITPAPSLAVLKDRLANTRRTSEFSSTLNRTTDIVITKGSPESVQSAVLLVRDDAVSSLDNQEAWADSVKEKEWNLARQALTLSSNLAGVQQFSAAVADTFQAQALQATVISFTLIGIYIWLRFKTFRYSIAAVVALIHDVLTVTGLLALCGFIYDMGYGDVASKVGLLPFKIDLNIVAALLTIAGYSLNDTVVVMDRIRENRGRLPYASAAIINNSINQTFSRTVITGGTTLVSCMILYSIGGEGMRAFSFALLTGLIFGTYSSVAVAAPIVWSRKQEERGHAIDVAQPATL
jgi:SecD/SecF fusion protein